MKYLGRFKWLAVIVALCAVAGVTLAFQDFDMDYKPMVKSITPMGFFAISYSDSNGAVVGTVVPLSQIIARSAPFPGQNVASLRALGTTTSANAGMVGWQMTRADEITTEFPFPEEADSRFGMAFRVRWTGTNGASVGGIRWKIALRKASFNVNAGNAHAGTDSILCARDSCTYGVSGNYRPTFTKWDTVGAATVITWPNAIIQVAVKLDSLGATPSAWDSTFCLGLDYAYVPKLTTGSGIRQRRVEVPGPTILGQSKGTFVTRLP